MKILATNYSARFGDSRGIVNARLVVEFKAREDQPAGTLVCEPFAREELEQTPEGEAYPYYSTTIDGVIYHSEGIFTPRI